MKSKLVAVLITGVLTSLSQSAMAEDMPINQHIENPPTLKTTNDLTVSLGGVEILSLTPKQMGIQSYENYYVESGSRVMRYAVTALQDGVKLKFVLTSDIDNQKRLCNSESKGCRQVNATGTLTFLDNEGSREFDIGDVHVAYFTGQPWENSKPLEAK